MAEYFEFQLSSKFYNPHSSYLDNNRNKQQQHKAIGLSTNNNLLLEERRSLSNLKELIESSMNLALNDKSCINDDEFLTRFLYARKCNFNEAFDLLINYFQFYKKKNFQLLQKLSIFEENIRLALRDGLPSVLKERDRRGRKIITFAAANWMPEQYSLEVVYKSFLLSLEYLLDDKQNQAQGFVVIVDWTNFTLQQSKHLTPKILKLFIEGLQDCFPAKFKAIHFIGQPWYVEISLAVIKPFLKEKTRQRINLHGRNLSTLHEKIPTDVLPAELGGEGPCSNHLDWYHFLVESSQKIEEPKYYKLTQTPAYSMMASTTSSASNSSSASSTASSTSNSSNNNNNNNNSNNNDNDNDDDDNGKFIKSQEILLDEDDDKIMNGDKLK